MKLSSLEKKFLNRRFKIENVRDMEEYEIIEDEIKKKSPDKLI